MVGMRFQPFPRLGAPISKRRSSQRSARLGRTSHQTGQQSMLRKTGKAIGWRNVVFVAVFGAAWPSHAQSTKPQDPASPYPTMSPIAQYRMERNEEISAGTHCGPCVDIRRCRNHDTRPEEFRNRCQRQERFRLRGGQSVRWAIEQPGVLESKKPEPHLLQSGRRRGRCCRTR